MHRKVAGEFLHYVNAINAIKVAVSDIVASVRYRTEDTLIYYVSKYLFFCFRAHHSVLLLRRSKYMHHN